jgi:gliding motility-associated-like protein
MSLDRLLLWALFVVLLLIAGTVSGQATAPLPTKGRQFWLGYMQNAYGAMELRVMIASQNGTTGTVTVPRTGWSAPFTVGSNAVTTVVVPVTNEHTGTEVISDKGILVQTQDSVTVSLASYQSFTVDAAQVLPLEALGTSYRVQGYRGLSGFNDFYKSELLVVATADDTEVEITPSVNTAGGRPAGVPFTVSLDAGQSYQVQSAGAALDITGTTVRGTAASGPCRPFVVLGGSMCANVPNGCPACDHIVEQMVPTAMWGMNFHTIPLQGVTTHTYRILADQNNTQVTINGGPPVLLNAGQSHLVNGANQPVCITADKPVSVAQLMEGFNCATAGDPSMIELMPDERTTTGVVFGMVASPQITTHSVSVVMPTAGAGSLSLNGVPVNASVFQAFPACPGWSHARLTVGAGTHRLASPTGFLAYAVGLGTGESYAYTLASKAIPVAPNDSLICANGPVVLNAPVPLVNITWTEASNPGLVLGTSASLAVTPTGNASYTVSGELAGSGCPYAFIYHVGPQVPQVLTLTANNLPAATVCQYGAVQLNVQPVPGPQAFDLAWSPASLLNDPTIPNPLGSPQANTWFRLDVTSPIGCGTISDSILVNVLPNPLIAVHANVNDTTICAGGSVQLTAQAEQVVASDVLNGSPGSMWTVVNGGAVTATCGAVSGDALYFNGAGIREARTTVLNVNNGGTVRFALKIATGTAPCDNADPGEDVVLEFSVNGGATWTTMLTCNEAVYPGFTAVQASIPTPAQTANTLFRWRQLLHSGAGQDNWMLDDVVVTRNNNVGLTFAWTPAAGLGSPNNATTAASPPATTQFIVTASGGNGCSAQDSVLVLVQPAFTITASDDTTVCDAGLSAQLQASPSYPTAVSWNWTPATGLNDPSIASPVATPTTTTTYTVTATSPFGCSDSEAVTVTVGDLTGVTVSATSTQLCAGSGTDLSAIPTGTGSYSFAWSPASSVSNPAAQNPAATPVATTTYTCTVTEPSTGCTASAAVTVNVNGPYTVDASPSDTLCITTGHQLNVLHNVPAPFTIAWSNAQFLDNGIIASPTILADTTATYVVTVTDAYGCSSSDSTTIISAWDNLVTPQTFAACVGQSILLDAGYPGSTYLWSTGQTTQSISVSTAGMFTVEITDPMGCVTVKTFFSVFNPLPAVNLGPDITLCGATSQVLNANSPGNSYLWSTGATTSQITVSQSSLYSVIVTSPQGCQAGDAINVTFNPLPVDVLQDITTCITNTVTLDAGNPGSSYQWSTGATSQAFSPSAAGPYSVTVTTPQNCTGTFDATITFMPVVTVALGPDTALCAGQPLVLDAGNPGCSYQWSTGATTQQLSIGQSGTYSVSASNGYCVDTDAITVTVDPLPVDVLQDVTQCADQPAVLNAGNPGSSFLWSTGEASADIIVDGSGTYLVTITNSNGCSIVADAIVDLVAPPAVDLGADTTLCDGEVLALDAGNPGSTYQWSTGSTAGTLNVVSSGTYTVSVDNGYCTRTDAVTATFNPSPTRLIERKLYTCLDEEPGYVVIDAGNPGSAYDWSTGASSQVILAGAYGWYYVQVTNVHDCTMRDSAEVIEFCPATLYVPNTFTPNGDGTNDIWMPVGKNIGEFTVMVFDRYGGILFQSNDPTIGWDGRVNGEDVKNDVYVWRMEYRFIEEQDGRQGRLYKQLGHVTVLR